jgi:integrase
MPRPRPPYLWRERTRHGRVVWYVRVRRGPRIRLKAEYGSPEFWAAYDAAIVGKPLPDAHPRAATGSLEWLWNRYRETAAWADLSAATRRQRENIMLHVLRSAGADPFAKVTRAHIVAGRDRRAKTPAQARNFLDAMRGLFRWAHEAGYVSPDPTSGVKNPARPKGAGFPAWTEVDVAAYEAHWPVGTRQRVWLDVLLYTGLRRGDVVTLGRQHVKDGIATLRTEKSKVAVTIPILPVLARTLEAGPTGDLAFICGERGKPFTKESFGNEFREAAKAAGLVGKSCHGVRKIGATRAAENGATVPELEAIFGWQGGGMAALYTRAADRARLAKSAMSKLERTPGQHSMPAPNEKVRAPDRKPSGKQERKR